MKRVLCVFSLLLILGQLQAQDIKLPVEVTGDPGDFIQIPATTDGKTVKWRVLNSKLKLFPIALLKDTKTAVVTAKEAGTYELLAWTAKGDEPSDAAICKVVIGGGGIDVNPTPPTPTPPTPTPVDPAVKRKLLLVIVEETLDATQARSKFFTDQTLRKRFIERGHSYTLFDKDVELKTAPASYATFLKLAEAYFKENPAGKYPLVFIMDQNGNKLLTKGTPMPASPADLIKLLDQYGG